MPRTCIVTGGTSGIGAATTRILRDEGWEVIPTGLGADEVANAGPGARQLDVRDRAAVEDLLGTFGTLDGLVNAAGVGVLGDAHSIDVFETTIDVNLTGTMRCCVAAHPALVAAGGAVVNIASVAGFVGLPQVPAYSAAKAGVVNLTRALASLWAEDGVRINAVAPGYVETPMTEHLRTDNARHDAALAHTPMGRLAQPEEIGHLIAFLLSDKASYITGSTHLADGGFLAT